ncbi:RICIN domain-containing protein [Streptomyces mauvecolor]|uniref:RICIN domain-containing protein n=1 Tax=Streptomyces mauvecolor TaxID=58345 RepID=A0ABV9UV23_9ACTN
MPIRHRLFTLVTAVLALLALAVAGAPAHADSINRINVWNSSHCLDNATENNAKLQMWSCDGGSDEKWITGYNSGTGVFTFTNQRTGWCITAPASGGGAVTMTAPCDWSALTQQWRVYFADNPNGPPSGWYQVWQNVSSGLCLATSTVRNGNVPQTMPCDPSDLYFRWHFS